MNLLTKQTRRHIKWFWGEGIVREFGVVMYTLLYLKWKTKEDLLYSIWNSAQCYVAVWMGGGGLEENGLHIHVWLSPFSVQLKLSQHCSSAIVKSLSCVRLFATLWTVAYQAPPSMGFSRQEYWSGLPFPSPGDLPDPGIEPGSPAFRADAITSEPPDRLYPSTK